MSVFEEQKIIDYFTNRDSIDLGFVVTNSGSKITARIATRCFLHGVFLGTTGSGKSSLVLQIMRKLLEKNKGIVVFDPHCSLVDDLTPRCAALGKKIVLLDLGFRNNLVVPWNFLAPETGLDPEDIAAFAVDSFDAVWGTSKTVRIMETLLHGFTALSSARMTIAEFARLFRDKKFRNFVLAETPSINTQEFFKHYESLSDSQKLQQCAGALNKISLLLQNKAIRRICCQNTSISLSEILNNPEYVLLVALHRKVPPVISNLFANLCFATLKNVLFSRVPNSNNYPTTFIFADEFPAYLNGTPDLASTMLAEGRKFGIRLMLIAQHMSQAVDHRFKHEMTTNTWFKAIGTLDDDDARVFARQFFPQDKDGVTRITTLPPFHFLVHLKKHHVTGIIQTHKPEKPPVVKPEFAFARSITEVDAEINSRAKMIDELIAKQAKTRPAAGEVLGDPFGELLQ